MNEERLRILKMVEEGKVSAAEGAELLAALEKSGETAPGEKARWLRVRVQDLDTGKPKVNVNLPLSLMQLAMKFVPRETLRAEGKELDIESILTSIKEGATGPIIDVKDEDEEVHVQIFVE
jgi:hypothetical protein